MTHASGPAGQHAGTGPRSAWEPGTRVVVRRRLGHAEVAAAEGRTLTDVIGVVVRTTPDLLVLHEDAGGGLPHPGHGPADPGPVLVEVPWADVVAGKVVPPRPARRPD
ncbi:hypothetical protein [Cellulosimicrobium marinum]|uniref:hypothetical protein n=1 Tax=Cellulosimicrobium marinum TaxID=1638992 RepID=UPI001E4C57F9|nr:hypothetical protein [Cellulosimicrobium marinum]MCB7136520.1 hypothetical protein [Cellulosimicrobium marinum]